MSIEENIIKIRRELMEFAGECTHLDAEQVVTAMGYLSDAEILTLYVENTFDVDWRGEILEELVVVSNKMTTSSLFKTISG